MCNSFALRIYLVFGHYCLMIATTNEYSIQLHDGSPHRNHHLHINHHHHQRHHQHHLKQFHSRNNSNHGHTENHIDFYYGQEAHRRSASSSSSSSPTLNAENPSNLSSTYSKPIVTSPLQLTLTQVNGRSIVSNNYPDVFNRHAYRWPFIASTTTAKPILLARKPDSQWQTGTNNVDVGLSSTAADVTSTQQAIVDHRAHAHHHTGLGRHVCAEYKSYQLNTAQEYQRHHKENQAMLCKNSSQCENTRHFYQRLDAKTKRGRSTQRIVYTCCPGWTKVHKDSIGCTKPICKRPCQNNGKCIKPEECSCPTGYTGTHCDLDIDECTSEKPCDQMCHNTDGSFYCTCRLGFILRADRQSCKKIDSTFGIDDTDIAFEAKDLENDVDSDNGLAVRMNNIEQMLAAEKKQNSDTNKMMQHILATFNNIKHRMDVLENRQHDINLLRERLKTIEVQAQTLQYNLEILYKCRQRPSIYCP